MRKFADEFFKIQIFNSVLNLNLTEEFYKVADVVRSTLRMLFFEIYGEKYAIELDFKSDLVVELNDVFSILSTLYVEDEIKELVISLTQSVQKLEIKTNKLRKKNQNESAKITLNFSKFEYIVMRFICDRQIEFLKPISEIFSRFDVENEGKFLEERFLEFLKYLNMEHEINLDVNEILIKLDPAATGVFTYSCVVSLLSMCYKETDDGECSVILIINRNLNSK